jgi:plasmid stability protein
MSRSVTIRHVPDEAAEELAARAARSGQSLQEYLRGHLIELAERPDVADLMARVRARKHATGSRLSVASVLAHREHDRR